MVVAPGIVHEADQILSFLISFAVSVILIHIGAKVARVAHAALIKALEVAVVGAFLSVIFNLVVGSFFSAGSLYGGVVIFLVVMFIFPFSTYKMGFDLFFRLYILENSLNDHSFLSFMKGI